MFGRAVSTAPCSARRTIRGAVAADEILEARVVDDDDERLAWAIGVLVAELDCRQPWHRDALSWEHPEVDFISARDASLARGVCAACSVRDQCTAEALAGGASDGIWAGVARTSKSTWACRQCGYEFTRKPDRGVKPPPRFCSKECSRRYQWEHRDEAPTEARANV
jgi:hypothetical protein